MTSRRPRLYSALLAAFILCSTAMHAAVSWLPFGPDGGDARRMAMDPHDPAHLYLGAANGWMYESHNFGANWVRLASVGKRDDLVLKAIVVDAKDPRHLIVGAYSLLSPDGGIFISNDAGKTWINQAEMRGQSVRSLTASASDPKLLIAGTLQGVFRSIDGGQRWKQISPVGSVELHNVESIAIDPKDPNIIYAGTWHLPWKSTDGGATWDNIKNGIIEDSDVFSIIVNPEKPKIVYASACSGIYKSLDAGETFEKMGRNGIIPSSARRTRILLQDPNHLETVFAGTTEGLWRSDDAGKAWTRTTGPEIIVNDVLINPSDSRKVLIATDRGGVMASDDGGDTFHSSNAGFSTRQIITMKRDSTRPGTLYIGIVNDKEWGGVFQSDNGGLAWRQRSEGLQGRDVFALGQAGDGTVIAGTSHGLFRLEHDAKSWDRIEASPTGTRAENAAHAAPAPPTVRPPVPVGRNQFAERKLPKNATPAQKRAAVLAFRQKSAAKGKSAARTTAARRGPSSKAKTLAAKRKSPSKTKAVAGKQPVKKFAPVPIAPVTLADAAVAPTEPSTSSKGFDGKVYALASAGPELLASTSMGLLVSNDNGMSWIDMKIAGSDEWRYLAAGKTNLVSATLTRMQFSSDFGATWVPVKTPEALTQLSAIAVVPNGEIWVAGVQGVFVSGDAGNTWTTPKNLFVSSVGSLFYDESTNRMIVTTDAANSVVFTVQLPQKQVTYAYAGWSLRFARPVGDHIVAATRFDGIVVQPKVVDSPVSSPAPAASH